LNSQPTNFQANSFNANEPFGDLGVQDFYDENDQPMLLDSFKE